MGLKDLFFKEDDSEKKESGKAGESKEQVTEEVELANGETAEFNFSFTEAGEEGAPEEGVFNQEIYDHLQGVIVSSVDGKGLEAFAAALENLSAVKMPEATKYQSAFITLKTAQGLTQEGLVSTLDGYIAKLGTEKTTFQAAADTKRDQQVGVREQEKANNLNSIEEKSAAIQRLTEEIQAMTERNEELDAEIIVETDSVTSSVSNFIATADLLEQELAEDKANIEKYLSTTKENA